MGSQENGDRRVFEKSNGVNPFYGSGWDPMLDFGNSSCMDPNYSGVLENQIMGNGSSSHLVNFPSDMLPKIPTFGNGNFPEMVPSFGHSNFKQNSENRELFGDSLNGKRKRNVSMGALVKNAEEENQQDTYEKKQNFEENVGANSENEQNVKEIKDKSNGGEPSKENYIHIRAKRGQATNSHSLAERVRRERISERMRLLQELVPGCNKITGKAVMLDEIINYVQSLQQQVEFLSMKLATVNPEWNMDIERIMSKDVLQSRGSITSALPFPGYFHGTFIAGQGTPLPFHPFPHNLWNNNELQSILQMGFNSDPPARSLGTNGLSKMEL